MTLEEIYYISQIVAVVAIFSSLIFVGVQVRQNNEQIKANTRALRATSHHAITDSFNAINTLIISDPKVARLWQHLMAGAEGLDDDERTSLSFMILGYMRIFETLHYQYTNGALDKKLFEAELKTLKWTVTQPGFLAWWPNNPIALSAEFRAFIDGLIRDAQKAEKPHP